MKRKKTVLVTSAGLATASNVISALRRSGRFDFMIVAVDMDEHAAGLFLADEAYLVPPVKDPSYLEKILTLVARHGIEFVFPLYSREIALFAGSIEKFERSGARLLIPDPALVALCDDKPKFLTFLEASGFGFPRTYASQDEVSEFPVFIKPAAGSSSTNTFRIDSRDELAFYMNRHPGSIIQEFVGEKEYTVDCLVDSEHEVVAAVPRERIKVKDGKSVVARSVKNDIIINEVRRLLHALGLMGPCNVQLFFDGRRVRFVEVNPRLAAGGLPLAVEAGVNIPELMVRIAEGEKLEPQEFEEGVVMVRYLTDLFIRDESIARA